MVLDGGWTVPIYIHADSAQLGRRHILAHMLLVHGMDLLRPRQYNVMIVGEVQLLS